MLQSQTRAILLTTPVSAITTVLTQMGIPASAMQSVTPVSPGGPKLVGPAFTMRYIPARPDIDDPASFGKTGGLQRRAIEECPAGSVLVIDARGRVEAACAGDMLSLRLQTRGVAGIVTDGGLRDAVEIAKLGLPAFFQRPAPSPTFLAHHPTDIDVPIGCGGVAVYPGDILVGDDDGVVVIPLELVEDVAQRALDIVEYDKFVEAEIRGGRSLYDVYPATPESRVRYATWREDRCGGAA